MGARIFPDSGNIYMVDADDNIIWSTNLKPVNLLPDENALVLTQELDYSEFDKRFWYAYARRGSGISAQDACISVLTLRPGNYDFPDIILGTVPAGVNFLDVRASGTRTIDPYPQDTVPVATHLPSEETFLPGGSCLLETSGAHNRMFRVVLDGTNVVLKMRQTSYDARYPFVPGFTTDYLSNNWSSGGGDRSNNSYPWSAMELKNGPNASNGRSRGGSNACRTDVGSFNTRSVYSVDFVIRPGYIDCVGPGCVVNGGVTVTTERQPTTGFRSDSGYSWSTSTVSQGGIIRWNSTTIIQDTLQDTEYYSTDGWKYMRGNLIAGTTALGTFSIARERYTFNPPT